MSFRAVLFDLDGTLADTLEDLADAMNWTLASFGLPTHPTDSYRLKVGAGIGELAQQSVPADRPELAEAIIAPMRARYGEHMFDKTRLYDGVPEMLDTLAERGVKLAVLSNKPHPATVQVVRKLLGRWDFAAVRGADPAVPLKPHPAAALGIAAELDIAPAEFLYLGDTNIDIQTAIAARMVPVGVLWGFRDEAELRSAGAHILIDHPLRLLDHV